MNGKINVRLCQVKWKQLCYSDETTKSINRRAVAVYDYLANAHPTWDEEEVAESMGYTASAIRRIRDAELCQDPEFIEDDCDDEAVDDDESYVEDGIGGFNFG